MIKVLSVLRPKKSTEDIDSIGAMSLAVNLGKSLESAVETTFMTDAEIPGFRCIPSLETERVSNYLVRALSIYREEGFDILHLHVFTFAITEALCKNILPTDKVVVTIHLPPNVGRSGYLYLDSVRKLAKMPNVQVVGVSNSGVTEQINKGIEYGEKEAVTIYNGVNQYPDIPILPSCNRRNQAVIIGRMEISKNILEGLTYCVTRNLPVVYIGKGTESKQESSINYEKKVREYIQDHTDLIKHYERLDNYNVHKILSESLFNLSLSTLESFGMSLVEANMVGTPNMYLLIDGVRDTQVDGLTGYCIPPEKIYRKRWESRYHVMDEILEEIKKFNRASSLAQNTYEKFSIEACASTYQYLYEYLSC